MNWWTKVSQAQFQTQWTAFTVMRGIEEVFGLLEHRRGPFHVSQKGLQHALRCHSTFLSEDESIVLAVTVYADHPEYIIVDAMVADSCDHHQMTEVKREMMLVKTVPYFFVKRVYSIIDQWPNCGGDDDDLDPAPAPSPVDSGLVLTSSTQKPSVSGK